MLNIFNFLTYVCITCFTPGPNNLTAMSNGTRHGFKKALPFNFGMLTGCTTVFTVCAIFGNVISTIMPSIKTPMLVLGAIYMFYLAYKLFMSSFKKETKESMAKESKNLFLQGLLLQFVNVKSYIYIIVSMEVYIIPVYAGNYPMLIAFAFFLACLGFISTLCWSLFGSAFKILFSKYAKITNTIMALLLVYCAISLFL